MDEERPGFLDRIRQTRGGRVTLKIVVGLLGGIVLILGVVMIPAPGPGWFVVIGGLSILSLEFEWARRLRHYVHVRISAWSHWVGRQPLLIRAMIGLAGLAFLLIAVWASLRFTFGVDPVHWLGQVRRS